MHMEQGGMSSVTPDGEFVLLAVSGDDDGADVHRLSKPDPKRFGHRTLGTCRDARLRANLVLSLLTTRSLCLNTTEHRAFPL